MNQYRSQWSMLILFRILSRAECVCFEPWRQLNEDLYFDGNHAKAKTGLLLISMAKWESNFDPKVDNGKKRGKLGEVCMLQVMPNMHSTKFDYSAEYLLAD